MADDPPQKFGIPAVATPHSMIAENPEIAQLRSWCKRNSRDDLVIRIVGRSQNHMLIGAGSRRRSASQAIDLPSGGGVNLGRLFTLGAPPKTITFAFLHNLDPTKTSSLIASGRPST
jgi:hypothetical protein